MTDQQQLKALIKSSKGPEEREKMGPVSTKQHRVFQNFPFSGSFIVSFSTMDIAFFFFILGRGVYLYSTTYLSVERDIFIFIILYLYSTIRIFFQLRPKVLLFTKKIFVQLQPKIISFNKNICSTSTKNNC